MASFWKTPAVVGTLSSLFFVILNVAMNIYMKWLFAKEGGDFPLPWTMLAIQQLEAYICLQPVICRKDPLGWGGWSFQKPEDKRDEVRPLESVHKPLEMIHLFQVLLVTLLFCLNVGLNSLSLVEISITLNQTVRAFLPVGVLLLSCIEQRAYPFHSYVTAGILVSGIALTCYGNPDFQWHGFLLVFISTWVAAAGTSLNGFLLSKGPFSKGGPYGIARLMMIQSVPAFFIFGLIAWFTERDAVVDKLMDVSGRWHWWERFLLVSVSSALALLSNLGRCFLVAATSALMETFAGNAKVAALCIIDHSLFGTAIYFHNYVGITLTFAGFSINLLLQYAVKENRSGDQAQSAHPAKTDVATGGDDEEGEMPARKGSVVNSWMRPRLVSAADTGLLGEHFALEMGREHSRNRSPSDLSASTFTAEHRPRAMTWQQGVDPLLQPEHTAATWLSMNLEWGQIWEAPSLSWLNGDRSRVASASTQEEYSPLSGVSPGMRSGGATPPASRSRFWSDQVHDRTPKSRRRDKNDSPTFADAGGAGLAPVQEEEDSAVELAGRCRATSGGGGYATDSDEDGDQADDWQMALANSSEPAAAGAAREFEPGFGETGRGPTARDNRQSARHGNRHFQDREDEEEDDDDDEDEDEEGNGKVQEHGETSPLVPSDPIIMEVQRALPPMDVGYL